MAVAEYMFQLQGGKKVIPDFIEDRGHWYNSADHTFVGWIRDDRDFYVPDSIVYLSKEDLVQRLLGMHNVNPFAKPTEPGAEAVTMTEVEVREQAEAWYDAFVAKNSGV